ncbi:4088_t:CDS:1, partial [Racocetra persica]
YNNDPKNYNNSENYNSPKNYNSLLGDSISDLNSQVSQETNIDLLS